MRAKLAALVALALVIDAKDDTFEDAGKVGLWTKADSVTELDALSVKPL